MLYEGSGKVSWHSQYPTTPLPCSLPLSLGGSQSLGPYEELEAFHLEDCWQKHQIRDWKQHGGAAWGQEPVCKNDNCIQESARDWNPRSSMLPRSMFVTDGTLLCCSCKNALISILEKLPVSLSEDNDRTVNQTTEVQMRVTLVDAISEV